MGRKKKRIVSKHSRPQIIGAAKGSMRILRRLCAVYDEGEYAISRELAVVMQRLLFDELRVLGVLRKLELIDSAGEPLMMPRGLERMTPYSPLLAMRPSNDGLSVVFVHWFLEHEHGITADRLEEISKPALFRMEISGEPVEVQFGPSASKVSFEKWRRKVIYRESDGMLRVRRSLDSSAERIEFTRENLISVFRNEVGAHFDSAISFELSQQQQISSPIRMNLHGSPAPFINAPSDAMIRAVAGELVASLTLSPEFQ